jgi:Flp pilus assembly protein TadG
MEEFMKRTQQLRGGFTAGRRRRGSTLLEFAMVVPVLLLLLLGIIEFGWFFKNQLTVANATREGARTASLGKTQTEIRSRVKNAMLPLTVTDDSKIVLESSSNQGASYTAFPADNTSVTPAENGVHSGDLIRVTVKVTHKMLTDAPLFSQWLANKPIEPAVAMVREKENGP